MAVLSFLSASYRRMYRTWRCLSPGCRKKSKISLLFIHLFENYSFFLNTLSARSPRKSKKLSKISETLSEISTRAKIIRITITEITSFSSVRFFLHYTLFQHLFGVLSAHFRALMKKFISARRKTAQYIPKRDIFIIPFRYY